MRHLLTIARSTLTVFALSIGVSSVPVFAQGPPAILKTAKTLSGSEYHNYRVVQGGSLNILGMLMGDITVEKGGQTVVRGIVRGDITNLGGDLKVYGPVSGSVTKKAGTTFIDPKATIEGGIRF